MRKIIEVMRLKYELNCSQQAITHATGIPRSTVKDYLMRANVAELRWPLPPEMTNAALNELLFPSDANKTPMNRPEPDWSSIHNELKRKAVTLQLLWEEYKKTHPTGYQYSWFAHLYRQWAKKYDVWMPQVHKAGEKIFVDYSGLKVPIWSTNLQEILFEAEIFVAVLGASDLIYCTATKSQQLSDWIAAHNNMFAYYGGSTELLVPDNLRSGVSRAHRYEPTCHVTYEEMAQHYRCAIMPARAYKPKDKAKAEKAVQLSQQRILAPIRHEKFCSLSPLNTAIYEQLEQLNNRHSKVFGCTRWELFDRIERSALIPLPVTPYELATWRRLKVNGSYHVCIEQHHYSVPYQFAHKTVEIRLTKNSVEFFYKDDRIACHQRDDTQGAYTTIDVHRPEAHRQQAQWHYKRLQAWADEIGHNTQQLIRHILCDEKRHLHQRERSALGILRLSHAYGDGALELACGKALTLGTYRYESLVSLLKRGANNSTESAQSYDTPNHDNVRGSTYYH